MQLSFGFAGIGCDCYCAHRTPDRIEDQARNQCGWMTAARERSGNENETPRPNSGILLMLALRPDFGGSLLFTFFTKPVSSLQQSLVLPFGLIEPPRSCAAQSGDHVQELFSPSISSLES